MNNHIPESTDYIPEPYVDIRKKVDLKFKQIQIENAEKDKEYKQKQIEKIEKENERMETSIKMRQQNMRIKGDAEYKYEQMQIEEEQRAQEKAREKREGMSKEEILEEGRRLIWEKMHSPRSNLQAVLSAQKYFEKRESPKEIGINEKSITELVDRATQLVEENGNDRLLRLLKDVENLDADGIEQIKENTKLLESQMSQQDYEEMEFLLEKIDTHKYYTFSPTLQQQMHIDAFGRGVHLLLYTGSNGAGKTALSIVELGNIIFETNKKYFDYPIFTENMVVEDGIKEAMERQWIIVCNTDTAKNIENLIRKYFPMDKVRTRQKGKSYISEYQCDGKFGRFDINIFTIDQNIQKLEAFTVGGITIDEPSGQNILRAANARTRGKGQILYMATDVGDKQSSEMVRTIRQIDFKDYENIYKTKKSIPNNAFIYGLWEDTCIEHGINGFNPHSRIEKIRLSTSEEDFKKRSGAGKKDMDKGKFVYEKFSEKVHVIQPFPLDPSEYVVGMSIDYHAVKESAIVWTAVDRQGSHFVAHEEEIKGSAFKYKELIERVEREKGFRVVKRVIDKVADIDYNGKGSFRNDLASIGLDFEIGSKEREICIQMTNDLLDFERSEDIIIKKPKLFIFSSCTRTVDQFFGLGYNEDGKLLKQKNSKDDMCEAVGRIVFEKIVFQEYVNNDGRGQIHYMEDEVWE